MGFGSLGKIFSWPDNGFAGKKFAQFIQTPGAFDLNQQGKGGYATGQDYTQQGVGQLNDLAGQEQGIINNGGLPDDVKKQFNIARGALGDDYTRNTNSFAARLSQRFATSGGQISPSAMNEYDLENQKQAGEGLFTATNNLNMGESGMALENTNALFGRLGDIAKSIAGVGQSEEQRGQDAEIAAMQAKLQHRMAMANFGGKIIGGMMGGMG